MEGRKALVLISPGFPQLRDFDEQLEHLSSLAREVTTSIYFVDTTGLDGLLPTGPRQKMASAFGLAWARSGGAMDLAEATGGFTTRFSNELTPALRRVAAEMRTYYILGYAPPRAKPGKFRRVKVKVNVDGAKARTKKGYIFDPRRSFWGVVISPPPSSRARAAPRGSEGARRVTRGWRAEDARGEISPRWLLHSRFPADHVQDDEGPTPAIWR